MGTRNLTVKCGKRKGDVRKSSYLVIKRALSFEAADNRKRFIDEESVENELRQAA